MNLFFKKVFVVLLFIATSTCIASSSEDGGMSGGGGGGTLPSAPVTETQIGTILQQARLEIYMALALESQGTQFPWPELFEGDSNIFKIIRNYQIFIPPGDCKDAHGNSADGSIYSPAPGTICISASRLARKLAADNARAQVITLVLHEYSHLQGFDEGKAQALQRWFTPVFANSSSWQAFNLVDFIMRQIMDLSDYLQYYQKKPSSELSWDFLCYLSEKVTTSLTIIEQQFIDRPFSVFHRSIYSKQNSYLIKQVAITTQVCARSQFHPQKAYFEKDVFRWFKVSNTIYDRDLAEEVLRSSQYDVRNNILVIGDLSINKINTFADFDREFSDVQNYIYDDLRAHLIRLWDFVEPKRP